VCRQRVDGDQVRPSHTAPDVSTRLSTRHFALSGKGLCTPAPRKQIVAQILCVILLSHGLSCRPKDSHGNGASNMNLAVFALTLFRAWRLTAPPVWRHVGLLYYSIGQSE